MKEPSEKASPVRQWSAPAIALLAGLAMVVFAFLPRQTPSSFDVDAGGRADARYAYDLDAFGTLPVLHEGRVKPIDTVARWTLIQVSNRSSIAGRSATQWLLDIVARPEEAAKLEVFRIDHPEVKALLGAANESKKYFSPADIAAANEKLAEQFTLTANVEAKDRNLYQSKLAELSSRIARYRELAALASVTPTLSPADVEDVAQGRQPAKESVDAFSAILSAYAQQRPADFNAAVNDYRAHVEQAWPKTGRAATFEAYFHRVEPFITTMTLYVGTFLLACFSWLGWRRPLWRAAMLVLLLALAVHTFGLSARVWIHGRPPVTNLYASAIFIGWGAVVMALCVELIHRNGIGSATAAVIGFATLIIAHHLDDGDNMEAVRAVLATNFWLSTHVVVVTLGYAATFLAGFVATASICFGTGVAIRNRLKGASQPDLAKDFARIVYGIICFATLLSFVGTVLGGIWADQSWGRFWGWDPKENGALLIVLWNALILHARWGGLVRERGIAVLAVFGNVVTSWSWFGVNMLGVGLHSYGFMDGGWAWLSGFMISQLLVMAVGAIPVAVFAGPNHAAARPTPAA
ncbi:MAG: cytochrome c biogenesis protein CcsA [Planctomycetota bacterium]|nr:cytochrome c biogenesis protein CcsA [Planctomycetota bacterium]